jgi:assimilatory nitrate reductase catalytic subunit
VLNTGRVRDHWHTLTRTGKSPRLSGTVTEPRAELHPRDAAAAGIAEGHLVRIVGAEVGADGTVSGLAVPGRAVLARAVVTDRQQPGSVFVPFHWNDRFAHAARVGVAIPPVTDAVSGQPAFKHARVRVQPFAAAWYGVVLCREELPDWPAAYRVRSLARGHRCVETAGDTPIADWGAWARGIAGEPDRARWIEYQDAAMGRYRGACLREGRLWACVHIAPRPEELPDRAWLGSFFARHALAEDERRALLAGMPGAASAAGPTVCACFGVGEHTLAAAIRDHGLTSVAQVGALLRAGTHCGSCVPDLTALLARHAPPKRAPQPRVAGAGSGGMTP